MSCVRRGVPQSDTSPGKLSILILTCDQGQLLLNSFLVASFVLLKRNSVADPGKGCQNEKNCTQGVPSDPPPSSADRYDRKVLTTSDSALIFLIRTLDSLPL